MAAVTFHTFAHCKSWPAYNLAYYMWMRSINHPDLARSNHNVSTWKDRNVNRPIPVIEDSEIYA